MMSEFSIHIDQERLQRALEAADIGIWDFDPVSKEIIWSKKCDDLFGLQPGQVVTIDTFVLGLHPEDKERAVQMIDDALNSVNGGSINMEYRIVNAKDGQIHWVRAAGKAYFNEKGQATRLTGILTEISHEKNIQARAKEKEQLVKDISDSAPVALWMTDEKGHCSFINQTWTAWTGLSLEEATGNGWLDAISPEDKILFENNIQNIITTESSFTADFRIKDKTGNIRWCLVNGRPRYSEKGKFIGLLGSCVDITERKQSEEALQFRTALLEAQNEATPNGILVTNGNDKILATNSIFVQLWDVPIEIIQSKDNKALLKYCMSQLHNPETELKRVQFLYEHPEKITYDELHLKNGNILRRYGRPIIGKDKTYYGWAWFFENITERKHSEEVLRYKTALFEAQNEATADGILVVDAKGKILTTTGLMKSGICPKK
jgi:PAS domain S-box-containing protein